MSVPLPGFTTRRLLRASTRTRVYEAERDSDGKRVVAKVFEIGDPSLEARVEHELRLLQQLDLDDVVEPLGIERAGRELVLLLDWVPGRSLAELCAGRPTPIEQFLIWAERMAAILAAIHGRRIIHRDIKPSNILVEQGSGRIVFADFGIAVLLESERMHIYDPAVLEGTLPYVSPEQTGRTRREVDVRSDLYSLGVTFYELLTGRRPFEASAPLELVHAHLARRPTPPNELISSMPERLAAIVMKLLEKAPEHRYQSAAGLGADLRRLVEALDAGEIEPSFALGRDDHPQVLRLPHQLYGREREQTILAAELDAAVRERSRRAVLIDGPVGVGKSALLTAVATALSEHHGYLALASFDEQSRDTPYVALVGAVSSLLEQILAESDEQLQRWRERLRRALGAVAGVVCKLIPRLSLVLGETAAVPELELSESRNRLHLAFGRLLGGFCRAAPLVFALDDLHWADGASLELIAALIREGEGPILFVLGCRSDERGASRPSDWDASAEVLELIAALERERRPCRRLSLSPLDSASLEQMLADMLGSDPMQVRELAAWVDRKTGSRPLLVRTLLIHLTDEGLLAPSAEGFCWTLAALAEAVIPDDVLDVLGARLDRISPAERAVLELAACVGERFEPAALAVAEAESGDAAAGERIAHLHALEQAGLIDAVGHRSFRFAHASLRGTVYERIEPSRRKRLHAAIARDLLARAGGPGHTGELAGEPLFQLADQLVAGLDSREVLAPDEVRELARLELDAGDRALEDAAWGSARRYYRCALELLGPGDLREPLRFRAKFGHAQSLHLDGENEQADAAFEALLAEELGLVDRATVVARRLRVLYHTGETHHLVEMGIAGLRDCGLELPERLELAELGAALIETARTTTLERLLELPPATDERALAIMHIQYSLSNLTFTVDRPMFVFLTITQLRLILAHGFHVSAIGVLHDLGFALLGLREFDEARRLGELGLALAEARGVGIADRLVAERAWTLFVAPCFVPFSELAPRIVGAHRRAIEAGRRLDAASMAGIGLVISLEACVHLDEVRARFRRFHAAHDGWDGANMSAVVGGVMAFHARVTGERTQVQGRAPIPAMAAHDDAEVSSLVRYGGASMRIWAAVLVGDFEPAWAEAEVIAGDFEDQMFGSWAAPRFALLDAVLTGERAAVAEPGARGHLRERIERRLASLRPWAARGPENYQPYVDIALGELAILDGDIVAATRALERGRRIAQAQGRAWVEGLACLRLAALAERAGSPTLAEGALQGAHRSFERWGAWAVVAQLEQRMGVAPGVAEVVGPPSPTSSMLATDSPQTGMASLDLAAVLATVHTISEDLRLEQVIPRVLASAIESAGADRGLLLLERDGEPSLVAEGQVGRTEAFLHEPLSLAEARDMLPSSVIRYVLRTGNPVVVDELGADPRFASDPYVQDAGVRSLLCMAIVKHSSRLGVLVLENRLQAGAFNEQRLETSRILLAQAASAIDNARLYAELARSEAQWRSLVDGAPDVITLLDEQGRIEFLNHLEPYVLDPRDWIDEPGDRLLEPSSAQQWRAALGEVARTGRMCELELCMAPPEGPRRWYMTRLAAIRVDGRPSRVLSIATDITERKGLEAQLRQQQRLESIGTLAAGVAHEINNPVQGILNYAELIGERPQDVATVVEFSSEIITEAQRVAGIVRNLLVFARQERAQSFEQVEVRAMIESTLSLVRAVIRKDNIQVELALTDDLPALRCRPQQIQQIIMNLVTNARDALNDRYPRDHDDKQIRIVTEAFERGGAWLRIGVEDRAGGIPEPIRAQIFDPFFTTKGRDQGTGLGLSVSHGIASEHGGELRVESEVGVGSTFLLELPFG